ncbi:hypothetical protein PsorP6_015287 [Peronosclerospora sorghi]|uniref:Uncharacterized protein n=1 Tax=Peronosclerospora sorghi TaxID=230839 RepID=A0ACC0VST6_9STRA|nr:hypothetical protein PsorP6_015287 [Peronosclerospora sorghi]
MFRVRYPCCAVNVTGFLSASDNMATYRELMKKRLVAKTTTSDTTSVGDDNKVLVRAQGNFFLTDRELSLMEYFPKAFPDAVNILCICHINQNMLKKFRSEFTKTSEWDAFMKDWNDHMHFTNAGTSNAEGSHAVLKRYLAISALHLDQAEEKLEVTMDNQYRYFKTHLAQEKRKIHHLHNEEILMQNISRSISLEAKHLLYQ